ncbi:MULTISPECIES: hypothetical protein [Shewanella]|uniref:hypothetical protein n=1 Tax=Shewanella TaxID=22 RepID=UPI001AAF5B44|nr:hypothetical protein [Shewanella algae]MBO2580287.1 hypothetical protein [Shewanella algae]HDS1207873.1 hypothetical protein [Shewanella algae]
MKISELVESVTSRFTLLLTGQDAIRSYLAQSLTAYRDMAGCIKTIPVLEAPAGGLMTAPTAFLAHAMCKDANQDFVPVSVYDTDDGGHSIHVPAGAVYPLDYSYFVDLAYYADKPESHIPNRVTGLIADYLEVLIAMDNDDRIARVETSGKMDASRLPTRQDRINQQQLLETSMRANREIVPMASIHP